MSVDSSPGSLRPRIPGWFVATVMHAVVVQAALQLLRVSVTYRAIELGASVAAVGLIAGSFAVLPTLLSLTLGRIIDRRGEAIPFRLGAAIFVIASGGFLLFGMSVPLLVLWSAMMGLGHLLSAAGEHSIIARCAEARRRNAYFGYYTVAISLGQVVGPFIVAMLAGTGTLPDTAAIFSAGVVLSGLVVLVTAAIVIPPTQPSAHAPSGFMTSLSTVFRTPGYLVAVFSGLIIFCTIDLIAIYLPVLGAERGISASVIAMLIVMRAAASIASRFFFDQLVTRLGRGRLLTMCLIGSALGLAATAVTSNVPLLAVSMFVAGLCLGVGAPMSLAWATEVAPPGLHGSALSLRLAGNRLGQTVVPMLAGLAAAPLGSAGVFVITAGSLAATSVIAARFFRRAGNTQNQDKGT